MKKIVILDLSKDIDLKIENSLIFEISYGSANLKNCKKINKNFFSDKKYKLYKKNINNLLVNFYKHINNNNFNNDISILELFNQRNDKNQLFNKIFNLIEILKFVRHKKINFIEIITDDLTFLNTYKSLKIKNLKVTNIKKEKISKTFSNYFFKTIIFFVKTFIIVVLSKLFKNRNFNINKLNEGCLSIFPLFYKKRKHFFYKKNLININFQITDETHLGNTLSDNIKSLFEVKRLNNTVSAESFIDISDISINFFSSLNNYRLIKIANKYSFKINNIDFSDQFRNLFFNSLLNYNKLKIYRHSLKKIFDYYNIKKFHFYLFEYNFGYYLSKLIREISPKTVLVGYQHGIYSERLMWQNFSEKINLKDYFPNEIVCKFSYSLEAYKKNFKNLKVYLDKNTKKEKKIKKIKFIKNQYNVYLGLHDCYNMINELRNFKKDKKFILNFHPKMKYENKLDLNQNIKIRKFKLSEKRKKILSSTSTIPYQLYPFEKFHIIVPKNIIPLNPKVFDKFIIKNN